MAVEAYLAILAVSVLHSRGFSMESLCPIPTVIGAGLGLLLYFAAAAAADSAIRPFAFAMQGYEDPMSRMMANARASLPVQIAFGVINGAYEEVFLLGFLMRGLRGYGLTVAIGGSLLVRLLYHTYMGPLGAMWVLAFGAVLSVYFMESGKLFPAVFAHAIADVVPFLWR